MSTLSRIEDRHRRDSWEDTGFLVMAALLIALFVGGVTSWRAGPTNRTPEHAWTLTVVEGPLEIGR